MRINKFIAKLKKQHACSEAVEYASSHKTSQQAWDNCERGDWMLWFIGKLSGSATSKSRKKLTLAACECARLTLQYVPKDEKRPLIAIETAEQWAKGDINTTLDDVRNAANAAYAAANAAACEAAYAAANAAACEAAYAAACAAACEAACAAASAAANAAACEAARKKTLIQCADIVRKHYPEVDEL